MLRTGAVFIRQADLAKKAKIDRSYLSQIENAQANVTVIVLHQIAHALGKTLSEFLDGLG